VRLQVAALVVTVLTLASAACSSAAVQPWDPQALAHGVVVRSLDAGKVASLPTGPLYVRFIRFAQQVGYRIPSRQHQAGIIYVEVGVQRLTIAGQTPIDIPAGRAKFHQSVAHLHINPGPGPSVWYFIALWPSTARSQQVVDPIAHPVFESGDIAPGVLPRGTYSMLLRRVDFDPHGATEAHRFGGLSAFFVLEGSVTIKVDGRSPTTLATGLGAAFDPGIGLQEVNQGTTGAVLLEFLTTPEGADFETPLRRPPG